MRAGKWLLCVVASLLLCLCLAMPAAAVEEAPEPPPGDTAVSGIYTYIIDGAGAVITKVDANVTGSLTIPNRLGGRPVTGIGDNAFDSCEKLTSVRIPDSVTGIGALAFVDCFELRSITFLHVDDDKLSIDDFFEYEYDSGVFGFYDERAPAVPTTIYVRDINAIHPAIRNYDWAGVCRAVTYVSIAVPTISSVTCSASSGNVGRALTWTATASGGTGELQYYFRIYINGRAKAASGWSTSESYSYIPAATGTYKVEVVVKDATGAKVTRTSGDVTVS